MGIRNEFIKENTRMIQHEEIGLKNFTEVVCSLKNIKKRVKNYYVLNINLKIEITCFKDRTEIEDKELNGKGHFL